MNKKENLEAANNHIQTAITRIRKVRNAIQLSAPLADEKLRDLLDLLEGCLQLPEINLMNAVYFIGESKKVK